MGRDIYEYDKMKKIAIMTAVEQLRLRGENAVKAGNVDRYDVFINDKDIRIKIKFSKPIKRSSTVEHYWEFTKIMHRSRLWPYDIYHYYLLMGLNENGGVEKIWKVSTDDDVIYRKNQIFIPLNKTEEYDKYELNIIDSNDGQLQWIE
jgi:hypothetical protein